MNPDLIGLAGMVPRAAKDIRRVRPPGLHRIRQQKGGAAGGVSLSVVVGLHNLHVTAAENGRGLAHQTGQQGHADGHVVGLKDRDRPGPFLNPLKLFRRIPCRGRHQG